jgi:hypothetical protein
VEIASLKKKEEERGIFRRSERPSRLEGKPMTHDFSSFNADRVNLVDSEEVGDRVRAYAAWLAPLSNNKVSISKFI